MQLITQGALQQGLDVAVLLQRAGISPLLLASPLSRVSQQQYAALIRVLRRATRDELWGLLSKPVPLGSFEQAARLLVHCRTLGDALRCGLRHYHPLLADFTPRLQVAAGMATIRIAMRAPRTPQLDYAERVFMFLAYGMASWLVARRIPLVEVAYSGTPTSSDVPRLFMAPVRYGQPQAGWRFGEEWLALPVVQNPQSLAEFLRTAPAPLLVRYRDRSNLTERIRRLLRRHLADDMPTLDDVGHALGISPPTLRRRLRDEGQGWQAIKDDLRRDAAIDLLAQPDLALGDIALKLGFSEASAFHRAFKHWTGVAPGEYRQRRSGSPEA